MKKNYTIWSNYPDVAEDMGYAEDADLEYIDFMTLRDFNNTAADIIAVADLGLWNGRVHAVRELNNVQDCFSCVEDYAEFYIDSRGDFRCRTAHHDGTNYILFRLWKDNISDEQRENFMNKVMRGAATRRDVCRYTSKISVADPFH